MRAHSAQLPRYSSAMQNTTIPDWVAAEIAAGRTELQPLLDRAPFPAAAVHTVAESGDFHITGGHVARISRPRLGTWFPQHEPRLTEAGAGAWALPVVVTAELLDGAVVPVPRAVAGLLGVPRHYQRTLTSELGGQLVHLGERDAITGPIDRFLAALNARAGERVELVFDPAGRFTVRR